MTDPTVVEIMEALADQIRGNLAGTADPVIEGLQVEPLLTWNPTPPIVDVYPADPFQEGLAFGRGNRSLFFTVRARVTTPDREGGQELLLSMMDPRSETSVAMAITEDPTLNNNISDLKVDGPSDYGAFQDPGGAAALLGCTWRVEVLP